MSVDKTLCAITIACVLIASIASCGNQIEDEESVTQSFQEDKDSLLKFTKEMSKFPVDYYVSDEMRCGELRFDSIGKKVFALAFGSGFELYSMDNNGEIEFINRFSDGETLGIKNDGTIISHYTSRDKDIEVICISLISDDGVSLIDTYATKIEEGETHYYKGVANIRKDYVGEHILSEKEWDDSVNTAEMFLLDSKCEIGEKEYQKGIRKIENKMVTLKYEDMVPYEGSNVYPGW